MEVSDEVKSALDDARRLLTKGAHNDSTSTPSQDKNVVEESTTVQLVNDDKRKDGYEVVVTRTTVISQPNSDDEDDAYLGSWSDTDLLLPDGGQSTMVRRKHSWHPSRPVEGTVSEGRLAGGSDDELNAAPRLTTAKYRRRKGGLWRKVANEAPDDIQSDELEVEVKEEIADETGHLVTKHQLIRWKVLKFENLPDWLQDNEFLRHGHRPPLPSFAECFRSIWSLHTETGNIWTHLIGCVAFFFLALWYLTRPNTHIQFQEKVVFSFFFGGAILCLGLSFAFHTVSCHSANVVRLFSKLDYMGISLLIIGSFIPWVYYGFYCRREPKVTYIAMIAVLGVAAIIVSLWDKFSESRYRPLRAGVFVGMGSSGVVPAVHYIITDGVRSLFAENSFHWLLLMAALYLVGALLYATRTPERFYPGKFDIWFQSHQLFHVCVVVAAFVHYYGVSEMAIRKLGVACPVPVSELDEASAKSSLFHAIHSEL